MPLAISVTESKRVLLELEKTKLEALKAAKEPVVADTDQESELVQLRLELQMREAEIVARDARIAASDAKINALENRLKRL